MLAYVQDLPNISLVEDQILINWAGKPGYAKLPFKHISYVSILHRLEGLCERIEGVSERIRNSIKEAIHQGAIEDKDLKEMIQLVKGKICFIGSTSTAIGDRHPTPMSEATPGCFDHTSTINMILTGQFLVPVGGQ